VSRGRPASSTGDTSAWSRPTTGAGAPGTSGAPTPDSLPSDLTPAGSTASGSTAPAGPNAGSPDADFLAYPGPPPNNPPPAHWRPPLVNQPLPPGELPTQDHDRLDVEEQAARTLTQGIGMVAGAILIVLLLILCARSVF
jgi:hypothetical protein